MSYSAHFSAGQGLHPKLILQIDAPESACALYTRVDVPAEFIVDRFQLRQLHDDGRLGARESPSNRYTGVPSLQVIGERDLEVPASKASNAAVLLQIRHASPSGSLKGKEKQVERTTIELPLHLRYQRPVKQRWIDGIRQDLVQVALPMPDAFWVCAHGESKLREAAS